ncbi:MAG: NAD(P)/FAD-dependent oxidoreductase [Thermomicrobiales bacterium]
MLRPRSRRSFLAGAASTVALALPTRSLARQATPGATPAGGSDATVIVIGAGLAGMGAAQALKLRGVPVVVLEARDRIGGRCFCDNTFPAPFDFGGQFFQQVVPNVFGGTNNPLFDMYRAQGGPDVPCVLRPSFYAEGVASPDSEQAAFDDTATAVGAAIAAAGIAAQLGAPDVSAADATSALADLPWYTMTTAFLALALDAPADRLSALDVWNDVQFAITPDGSPSDKVNPSGMGNFAAQFAAGLDIRLSTPVTAIDLSRSDRITVTTDKGPLTAQAVIVTAPATVLAAEKIAFTPALPVAYQQAFADLPFGVVDKLGIAFDRDIFDDTPANTVITRHLDAGLDAFAMALAKLAGQPMMNLFFADDLARELEAGGTPAQEAFAREYVTDTYGADAAKAIAHTIIHPWASDPWTMGSYSAAKVGKVGARATLAQPIDDRLFFAGEAVSTTAHSSLHGAYLTGQAAATQIADGWGAAN